MTPREVENTTVVLPSFEGSEVVVTTGGLSVNEHRKVNREHKQLFKDEDYLAVGIAQVQKCIVSWNFVKEVVGPDGVKKSEPINPQSKEAFDLMNANFRVSDLRALQKAVGITDDTAEKE